MSPRLPKRFPRQPSAAQADLEPARPDEAQLFREAVRDVRPLDKPAHGAAHPARVPRRPPPSARFSRADRLAVLEESLREDFIDPALASGEELVFHRAGIQPALLRKLRRGDYRVQGEIEIGRAHV